MADIYVHNIYDGFRGNDILYKLLFTYFSLVGMETPRILAVCCSSSEPQVTAVRKFLGLLEAKCNLRVVTVDNDCIIPGESVQDWLMQEINLASKVVLFHSEESVLNAWRYTGSGVTNSVSLQIFVTALEMFANLRVDQSKLLNIYFSYTPYSCVVRINCGQTYKLIDQFDQFLANVHARSSFDKASLLKCKEGRELQRAIAEAAAYAAAHPFFVPPDPEIDSIDDNQSLPCMLANIPPDTDTDSDNTSLSHMHANVSSN